MSDLTQNDINEFIEDVDRDKKDVIWASGHYLTNNFPEEFTEWEEDEIDGFIEDNIWQPFQYYSPSYVWEQIYDLAISVRGYINEQDYS